MAVSAPPRTRALCIVNPAAGKRHTRDGDLEAALRLISEAGFDLEIAESQLEHPTAAELAEHAVGAGVGAVIVAGGDGTVQPAAAQLLGSDVVLGILPFGRFMNIAKGLAIPFDPIEAARVIAARHARRVDVGEANGRVFYETAGVGLDAQLFGAARLAERGKWKRALHRAWRWATQQTHRLTITVDGTAHQHRVLQVLVQNGPYYGWSFPVVPEADMHDGVLEVAVYPRMGRRDLIRSLLYLWRTGTSPVPPVVYSGADIRIEGGRALPIHADGQLIGSLPVKIRCRPGALAVYVPEGP